MTYTLKVGPEEYTLGYPVYRYSINGTISVAYYYNAASARQAGERAIAAYERADG